MRPPKVDMVNEDLGKQQKVAIIHQVSQLSHLWFLYLCLLMLLCSSRTVSHMDAASWGTPTLAALVIMVGRQTLLSALVGQQMLAAGLKVSLWLRLGTSTDVSRWHHRVKERGALKP